MINCSSYEGLPNTVIEAMACGTTVIASDIGPHRDLLVEGRTGFLVPLGNTNIFEKIIVLCATDMALVKRMGKCASAAVVNEFSWSDVTGAYEKLALAPEIR